MRAKHLFWLVPVLVLAFALFPQSTSWEDEVGDYEHPISGLWVRNERYDDTMFDKPAVHVTLKNVNYRGQLVAIGRFREHHEPSAVGPGAEEKQDFGDLSIELGWQPQLFGDTVVLFWAGSSSTTYLNNAHVDWVFSPAYQDDPWEGLIGVHFELTSFMDDTSGGENWKKYKAVSIRLSGSALGGDGCHQIYLTRGLEDDYFRLDAGCFVYPSNDPRF